MRTVNPHNVAPLACWMLIWLFASAPAYFSRAARAENRLGLVIGNDQHLNLPSDHQLLKAVNDSAAIAEALEKLGFKKVIRPSKH